MYDMGFEADGPGGAGDGQGFPGGFPGGGFPGGGFPGGGFPGGGFPGGADFGPEFMGRGGFSGLDDLFRMFGGRGRGQEPFQETEMQKQQDVAVGISPSRTLLEVTIDFMEAVNGAKKSVTFERLVPCSSCHGQGTKRGSSLKGCSHCQGTGYKTTRMGFLTMASTCGKCGGSGKTAAAACEYL